MIISKEGTVITHDIESVIDCFVSEYGFTKTIEILKSNDQALLSQYVFGLYMVKYHVSPTANFVRDESTFL